MCIELSNKLNLIGGDKKVGFFVSFIGNTIMSCCTYKVNTKF